MILVPCQDGFIGPTCSIRMCSLGNFTHRFDHIYSLESKGLCDDTDVSNEQIIFSMTFGSGLSQFSNATPIFKVDPKYQQRFRLPITPGTFAFINAIDRSYSTWHVGALDHTENDTGGYMFVTDADSTPSPLFKYLINHLCIGCSYEFSIYVANVNRKYKDKPIVTFEVRSAPDGNLLLAQISTGEIKSDTTMTWRKSGISFRTWSSSVLLLIISSGTGSAGNDMAIDDITLRTCPNYQIDHYAQGKSR